MIPIYRLINKLANSQRREFENYSFPKQYSAAEGRILHFLLSRQDSDTFQKDIEKEFGLRSPSATSLLKSMEKNRLIERVPIANDGRYKKIIVTPNALQHKCVLDLNIGILEDKLSKDINPADLKIWENVSLQILKNLNE